MDFETCPFCETNDNLIVEGEPDTGYWVHCCNCSGTGPMTDDPEDALILWASRTSDILSFKSRAARLLPI